MACNCVEQTHLVPKGHQNGIESDLVNNGPCKTIFKSDREMQPVHNGKNIHHIRTGCGCLKKRMVVQAYKQVCKKYSMLG